MATDVSRGTDTRTPGQREMYEFEYNVKDKDMMGNIQKNSGLYQERKSKQREQQRDSQSSPTEP